MTEKAFENPKFVEDVARDVAEKLGNESNITHFVVRGGKLREHSQPQRLCIPGKKNEGGKV